MRYAVVFGGKSYEHEISIVSAIALKSLIDAQFVFLDPEHTFYEIPAERLKAKLFSSKEYKKMPKLEIRRGGFFRKTLFGQKPLECDVVIDLVHGADGEDGKLAALFQFYDIDFIGPRVEGSVVGFNKLLTKLYAEAMGCEVIEYQLLDRKNRAVNISLPLIVKPLRLGSSIGLSVVKDEKELEYALDVAFEFDDQVLVEPFIEGIEEYNLAGCKADDFVFSRIEHVKKGSFLDFEQKYMDFARSQRVEEAKLDPNLQERMKETFTKIYDPLFLGALVRMDFFVHEGKVYLNEINAVPGSLANYLFDDFPNVLERLATHLPKPRNISVDYRYLHSISAKK